MKKTFLYISIFFAAATSAAEKRLKIDAGTILIDQDVMTIKGAITPKLAEEFDRKFTTSIKTIVINSEGGYSTAGIKMAERLYGQGVTLIVNKQCLSACADSLFIAADKKIILPNAVVGWHGGAMRRLGELIEYLEKVSETKAEMTETYEYVCKLSKHFDFLEKRGIDYGFAYYAELATLPIYQKHKKSFSIYVDGKKIFVSNMFRREFDFWAPGIAELEKYGIGNVIDLNDDKKIGLEPKMRSHIDGQNYYHGNVGSYFPRHLDKSLYPTKFDLLHYRELMKRKASFEAKNVDLVEKRRNIEKLQKNRSEE